MDIGAKIRNARLSKGLTQEELGDILGVQKSAIAKYENGRVVNIKRSTLKKISDVLGIPPYELVYEQGKENPPEDPKITEGRKKLLEFANSVPESKIDLVLRVMQSIVEADQ